MVQCACAFERHSSDSYVDGDVNDNVDVLEPLYESIADDQLDTISCVNTVNFRQRRYPLELLPLVRACAAFKLNKQLCTALMYRS